MHISVLFIIRKKRKAGKAQEHKTHEQSWKLSKVDAKIDAKLNFFWKFPAKCNIVGIVLTLAFSLLQRQIRMDLKTISIEKFRERLIFGLEVGLRKVKNELRRKEEEELKNIQERECAAIFSQVFERKISSPQRFRRKQKISEIANSQRQACHTTVMT